MRPRGSRGEGAKVFSEGAGQPVALADADAATAWLRDLLNSNGPQRLADLTVWAETAGHARWAVERATRRLGIEVEVILGIDFRSLPARLCRPRDSSIPHIQFFHSGPKVGWISRSRAPPGTGP